MLAAFPIHSCETDGTANCDACVDLASRIVSRNSTGHDWDSLLKLIEFMDHTILMTKNAS